jgi:hypothetical protein
MGTSLSMTYSDFGSSAESQNALHLSIIVLFDSNPGVCLRVQEKCKIMMKGTQYVIQRGTAMLQYRFG